mmetsp:Transcript_88025/g.222190  ORF Transcript_88025/g.222190 Transcript_88025/m.222190 type:complete len:119 (-) Transcript_88025:85-441(-)
MTFPCSHGLVKLASAMMLTVGLACLGDSARLEGHASKARGRHNRRKLKMQRAKVNWSCKGVMVTLLAVRDRALKLPARTKLNPLCWSELGVPVCLLKDDKKAAASRGSSAEDQEGRAA